MYNLKYSNGEHPFRQNENYGSNEDFNKIIIN